MKHTRGPMWGNVRIIESATMGVYGGRRTMFDSMGRTLYVPVGWVPVWLARQEAREIVRAGILKAHPWIKFPRE